jgi:hypothetical protein
MKNSVLSLLSALSAGVFMMVFCLPAGAREWTPSLTPPRPRQRPEVDTRPIARTFTVVRRKRRLDVY